MLIKIRKKLVLPRVLSCLHFFCDPCISKLMVEDSPESIKCPLCDQITKVSIANNIMTDNDNETWQ